MDFTEDPFKDYRYEDPFNIDDPFADAVDAPRSPPDADRLFSGVAADARPLSGVAADARPRSGRVSAPPAPLGRDRDHDHDRDPFAAPANNGAWAAWPDDGNWAADNAWPADNNTDNWANKADPNTDDWAARLDSKTDNWAAKADSKTDNWATKAEAWPTGSDTWTGGEKAKGTDDWADWSVDHNKNLNETWPSSTLPAKKEKSPKPVQYAKSLVHTIGGIGRSRQKKPKAAEAALPSEEQQWAWAAAESRRLQAEAEARSRREDAELQLALALSRREN